MTRGRLPFFAGLIFGVVGLLMSVVAVAILVTTLSSQSDAVRTEGTVVDVVAKTTRDRDREGRLSAVTTYYPTVRFTVDGRSYQFSSKVGSNPSKYDAGDKVSVAYDADDPNKAHVDTFVSLYLLPLIVGGLGVLFLGVGSPIFVSGVKRLRRDAKLRRDGHEVWADITDIALERNVRINNRHPYVVYAQWTDARTGETYTAQSEYIRENPAARLNGRTQVRVLTDPADPSHNVMDVDAYPPAGVTPPADAP